ncbi:Leucine-rich repeat receptor-like protein kinase pxc1 [Thalictrum thalictroides]|uniref:Leucine-rich repeat receptor-like protein kinase pxc1 n=1 Tax=Thalictrum thalictroides TaxID=46969 RepID=A0A7J6XBW1_THATH|nr:Leucine-rich repeat receptor-like protein kinase pxc1 [Thalictrum thalictroides]
MGRGLVPCLAMILVQFCFAGMTIVTKLALDSGMNPLIMVTYRQIFATLALAPLAYFLERRTLPRITAKIIFQMFLCSILGATLNQCLYFIGLRYSTPTMACALNNLLPAITFVMAVPFKIEIVEIRKVTGQAKVAGTIICVTGAMLMSFYKGNLISIVHSSLHWSYAQKMTAQSLGNEQASFIGPLFVIGSVVAWSGWFIVQAKMNETFIAPYTTTTVMCFMASLECALVAVCWEDNFKAWSLAINIRLIGALYNRGWIKFDRGGAIHSSLGKGERSGARVLTQFRSQTDSHSTLLTNWTSNNACSASWIGVKCTNGRVTALSLPSLNLRGPINSLAQLDQLRLLNLQNNRLNGTLHPITNCSNLKLVYLSRNDFYGEIPLKIGSLRRLLRLDFSNNNLQGLIPNGFLNLTRLVTVLLQNNLLSGEIPDFSSSLIQLKKLNFSNNKFYGKVPNGMQKKFGEGSFGGNVGLCGLKPLPVCSIPSSPSSNTTSPTVVSSNPSLFPSKRGGDGSRKGLSTGVIVAIVVGNIVVLLLVLLFVVGYVLGRRSKSNGSSCSGEKKIYASNADGDNEGDRSKLVFFDKSKVFGLEELLRASAEMLGKGSLGTVYRAELDDGYLLAVKRLKDANPCTRKDFEQYMDVIGKLRHPNIVCLRAFYYAKDEKLLVYDYLPNGSLHYLLHGNRGPGRIPLDWTTRIGIVLGAARGIARIHEEHNASSIPHGNVKSSNVLLDSNGVACISDFGLALLLNPSQATARLGGYKAPEQVTTKKLSQKADVYSFGVLILEVLTGKAPSLCPPNAKKFDEEEGVDLPKWVISVIKDECTAQVFDAELLRYRNIEEELVAMLHVGLSCVAEHADKRPAMSEVAKMIQDIRVEQSPLAEDLDESRNSLSPSNATTEDARASY